MPLASAIKWKNRFILVRHGQSEANQQGIIASGQPGIDGYGLTTKGNEQAIQAAKTIKKSVSQASRVKIFCSDLLRTLQTAKSLVRELQCDDQVVETRFRERNFGDLNLGPDAHYQHVWNEDVQSANHERFNVESVSSVATRSSQALIDLNERFTNEDIVIVSHGDVLQILQTWILSQPITTHRTSVRHIETGEARMVIGLEPEQEGEDEIEDMENSLLKTSYDDVEQDVAQSLCEPLVEDDDEECYASGSVDHSSTWFSWVSDFYSTIRDGTLALVLAFATLTYQACQKVYSQFLSN